ncbi:MAG: exo-alpha-sialidase [Spirochaetes bacterium]|nr:exo-alpha-sialidase [Spirochaetota bacterium]MBN2772088.1 exo-alpha-sialidase [Spirochaetota bacterium]
MNIRTKKNLERLVVFMVSFVLFFVLFSWIFLVKSAPVGWSEKIRITQGNTEVFSYNVFSRGTLTAVAWYGSVEENRGVYASVSFNGGKSFFKPVLVGTINNLDQNQIINPRVAISENGMITIVWQNLLQDDPAYRIYYSDSTDRGINWSSPDMVPLTGEMQVLPLPFYDDKNSFHLVYHSLEGQQFSIYHTTKKDNEYKTPARISLEQAQIRGAFFPAVVTDKSNIYVVWQGKDNTKLLGDNLYFTYSDNYGKEWSVSRQITFGDQDDNAPQMIAHDSILYLTYLNNLDSNWKVNFLKGFDYGSVWEEKSSVVHNTNIDCFAPFVYKAPNNRIGILWQINRDNRGTIYSSYYDLAELKFSDAQQLTEEDSETFKNPFAFVYNNQVSVLWNQQNALSGVKSDIYTSPPEVFSLTHPFGKWSQFETAELKWKTVNDPSGLEGYAMIVNREPYFDPTVVNLDASSNSASAPFLTDGISYFHIRAVDKAGNYSRTIHYPLLVSNSPLSVPRIRSLTHTEGESSKKRDAVFEWDMDDTVRIKGYYYSLTKDRAAEPKKFIEKTELEFKNLADGRYFLTLRGIDKADNPGRIATYELIIGESDKLTPEEYEKIALSVHQAEDNISGTDPNITPVVPISKDYAYEDLAIELRISNAVSDSERIISAEFASNEDLVFSVKNYYYAVYKNSEVINQGSSDNGIMHFKNLSPGEYSVRVWGEYVYNNDPERVVRKSDNKNVSFVIDAHDVTRKEPLDIFIDQLTGIFAYNWQINSMFILTLLLSLISSIVFFRLYYVTRTAVSRIIRRLILIF